MLFILRTLKKHIFFPLLGKSRLNYSIFTHNEHQRFTHFVNHRSATNHYHHQQESVRGCRQFRHRHEMLVSGLGSMSMSRMYRSSLHHNYHNPNCQIQAFLSHPFTFSSLQEKLLIVIPRNLLFFHSRCFVTTPTTSSGGDNEIDSDVEFESEFDGNDRNAKSGCVGGDVIIESGANLEEVERVYKVINELFGSERNMEAVLDECNITLSHDLVVDVLQRFHHARGPAYIFFCWAGEKEEFIHDSRTYNEMMSILAKSRQFETMVALLEEMGEKQLLTMETFSISIKAFGAAKQRKKEVGIFELMKKYQFKVGVGRINLLLDVLGREKLGKEAQVLFEKLQHRFTPNLQTYTVLLNGWCTIKNLLGASKVWNEMIDKGFKPDIVAHNIMIEGLLRGQKKSDAIKLFHVMKSKGPSPDVRSYTLIIRYLCKHKKVNEAAEFLNEMIESGCQSDAAVYTCLIAGFGKMKKMDEVYGLLKEMRERGIPPDGHTYNVLIKLMKNQKLPSDAARIYNEMIQSEFEPTIHTYNMLMKSYSLTTNCDMAVGVWDEMNKKGCCPDNTLYTVFIGVLIRHGRYNEACRYVEEMIQKGMKAPQIDYNNFIADFSLNGKPFILEELSQKMKFAGKFDVSNVFSRWAKLMKARVKRRDYGNTDR